MTTNKKNVATSKTSTAAQKKALAKAPTRTSVASKRAVTQSADAVTERASAVTKRASAVTKRASAATKRTSAAKMRASAVKSADSLEIEGLETARFECVYPSCGGICCMNGRPPLEEGEAARIEKNLAKFLPHLRPEARQRIEEKGHLTNRQKEGLPALAISKGWCVFFNDGCVLHKVGAEEGDKWKYKPWRCIAFPLERSAKGKWHVRQWKLKGEAWDLFCLNPKESPKRAGDTLKEEIQFARDLESGKEAWRKMKR